MDLGRRIRDFRERRGLSGRARPPPLEVTSGFISQVEAGSVSPSVATLVKLAAALDVPLGDFFGATAPRERVVRRNERVSYTFPDGDLTEERLCSDPRLDVVEARLAPGASTASEPYTEAQDLKFHLVLSGELVLELGDQRYELTAGDAITFSGDVPHRLVNGHESEEASLLWVNLPKR